ncbi:ABC-2 family transporter protein [Lactobacillus sp. ESL0791]|uniref:ABC transporter permease n=1 Tax=Lactobacillus sp. ESL0791 TaxID=2983234 RepID=UPI0023F6E9DE|nr:ABC-2 family transporter protein [Lactobacillus sp. ESL0791]MDF7638437.1 ABC-2 family transporter protein [Lactobacillus sp. ESL0791]
MQAKLTLVKIGIKKGFSSKYALVFYLFSALISVIVQYFLWQAVLVGRPVSEFRQTVSYLVLMQLLTILFPKTSYDINDEVRTGDISVSLLKPISLFDKYLFEGIGYSLAKLVIVGLPEILIYFCLLDFKFSVTAFLMVTIAAIFAYLLYFELELVIGSFSFYTYSIWGIATFKSAILLILSGNDFPANFYPALIKQIAGVLPFQYTFGSVGLLAQNPSGHYFLQVICWQIFYLFVLYLIYNLLFKRSLDRLVIQGG